MKRFSSQQEKDHAAIVDRLQQKRADLDAAIEQFNSETALRFASVRAAQEAMQEAINEGNEFLDGVRDEAQTYYDDRSEKWQEGEKGEAFQSWISELETTLDDMEIDEPPEVSDPDFSAIDTFENIPQAVED